MCVDDEHGRGIQTADIVTWAENDKHRAAFVQVLKGSEIETEAPDLNDADFNDDFRGVMEIEPKSQLRLKLETIVEKSGAVNGVRALKELELLLDDPRFEYLRLTPEEWIERGISLIQEARAGGVMFLFDQDLGTGMPKGSDFLRQAIEWAADDKGRLVLGLLSYNVPESGEEEWMRTEQLLFDVGVTPISKNGILKPDNMGRRLKLTLLRPGCRELRSIAVAALKQENEKVLEQVSGLYELAFDQIVIQVSEHEGAWEPDAIIRVYEAMIRNKARSELRTSDDLKTALPRLRDLSRLRGGGARRRSARRRVRRPHGHGGQAGLRGEDLDPEHEVAPGLGAGQRLRRPPPPYAVRRLA